MSKKDLWYIQLDVDDWGRDLDVHPIEIEGAWLRICRKLFYAPQRGRLTWSIERWALVLNVGKDEAKRICTYLFDENIASGRFEHNGNVTLVSRRMMKDDKSRELNRLRQQSFRDKRTRNAPVTDMSRENNAPCNADVTRHTNININSNSNIKNKKIAFDDEKRTWLGIADKDLEGWHKSYPACDIQLCLNQMIEWLLSNPTKKKSNYRKFITNWLTKEQDKGGNGGATRQYFGRGSKDTGLQDDESIAAARDAARKYEERIKKNAALGNATKDD